MKKYTITVMGITFLLALLVFLIPIFQKKNLKDAIAEAVNVESSALILNIPPMPARSPGSILAPRKNSFMVYVAGDEAHKDLMRGESFAIEAIVQNMSQVRGSVNSNIISTSLNNNEHLEVSLSISNARILELPISTLKQLSKENSSVQSALKRGLRPLIVNRSYFGNVEYIIKAKDDSGIDVLAHIADIGYRTAKERSGDFKFTDKLESKKEVSFSIAKPVVFAYEVMDVGSVTKELSGAITEISLTPVSARRVRSMDTPITNLRTSDNRKIPRWGLVTISTAHYPNDATLNIPQATEGANLVEELLKKYNPAFSIALRSTQDSPLTDEKILDWSIDLTMKLLQDPVDHLLVYYTGHGLSLPNGELLLLQGNVDKDFAERALEAANLQTASIGDGVMLAETLHSAIGAAGIPFTLIIDACYPNDEMQQALTRVSMSLGSRDGTSLYYHGDQALITNEMSEIAQSVSNIGQKFPYRYENNAVIFSSKPGATSVFYKNPINAYGLDLPPLAARMLRYSQYAPVELGDQSIANLIHVNIDLINGVGEVGLSGSITWSNIDLMQSVFSKRLTGTSRIL